MEQDILGILSSATGLSVERIQGLNNNELYDEVINVFNNRIENAFKASEFGIGDYINEINSIEKAFENIFEAVHSSEFWELFNQRAELLMNDDSLDWVSNYEAYMNDFKREGEEFVNIVRLFSTGMLQARELAREERGKKYLANVAKQIENAGKSTYELAAERLMIEKQISEAAAIKLIAEDKKRDDILYGADWMQDITEQINDTLKSIRSGEGGYGQYAAETFVQTVLDFIQGSDVGNFVEGFQDGPLVGVINVFVGALTNIKEVLPELDYKNAIIYVNGFEIDENYILKKNDICTIRVFPEGLTGLLIGDIAFSALVLINIGPRLFTGKNIFYHIREWNGRHRLTYAF